MHRTYELYGDRPPEPSVLRVVTCDERDIVQRAQDMLHADGVEEVRVLEAGKLLFTLIK